jgi:hypothetical protein
LTLTELKKSIPHDVNDIDDLINEYKNKAEVELKPVFDKADNKLKRIFSRLFKVINKKDAQFEDQQQLEQRKQERNQKQQQSRLNQQQNQLQQQQIRQKANLNQNKEYNRDRSRSYVRFSDQKKSIHKRNTNTFRPYHSSRSFNRSYSNSRPYSRSHSRVSYRSRSRSKTRSNNRYANFSYRSRSRSEYRSKFLSNSKTAHYSSSYKPSEPVRRSNNRSFSNHQNYESYKHGYNLHSSRSNQHRFFHKNRFSALGDENHENSQQRPCLDDQQPCSNNQQRPYSHYHRSSTFHKNQNRYEQQFKHQDGKPVNFRERSRFNPRD